MFGAPPIRMELPNKKEKDPVTNSTGPDPNVVSHDIYYSPGSTEKYSKDFHKLMEKSTPEEYCKWREEIRDLLREKERNGVVAYDLKVRIIRSCMEAGERCRHFVNKVEEYAQEVTRQIAKEAAQAAAEAANARASEEADSSGNPQSSSKKEKKKLKKQKEKEALETPQKATQEQLPEEFQIPRRAEQLALSKRLEPCIWRAMNDLGLMVFDKKEKAAKYQREYLLHNLQFHMGNKKPEKWAQRLFLLNNYMEFHPLRADLWTYENQHPRLLDEEELTIIIHKAAKPLYHLTIKQQGKEFNNTQEVIAFLTQLYDAEQFQKLLDQQNQNKHKNGSEHEGGPAKKRHKGDQRSHKNNKHQQKEKGKGGHKGDGYKECSNCGKPGHLDPECWLKEENAHLAPWNKNQSDKPKKDYNKSNKFKAKRSREESNMITKEGLESILTKVYKNGKKAGSVTKKSSPNKRTRFKADYDADYESQSDDSLGSCNQMSNEKVGKSKSSNDSVSDYSLYPIHDLRPKKKSKHKHYSADVVVEIENLDGERVPIRALLDTGTSATIILRPFVKKGRISDKKKDQREWKTMGGKFITKRKATLDFKFPELNNKTVTWKCHVDDTHKPHEASYDMIIGLDLMVELGIFVNTATLTVDWEDHSAPLKPRGYLSESDNMEALYHLYQEPPVLQQAEERHNRIVDADYSAVDIRDHVSTLTHLSTKEKELLIKVLSAQTNLFKEGLGLLNIRPVELEVQEGAKPFHVKPFPIPYAYEGPAKKEIGRFCDIGVMENNRESEWGAPTFFQPKKKGNVGSMRVLTDFRRLNAVLKRHPFPLPKISDLLLKLQGFKYATALDLSMGYYHIPLSENSQKLCTTVLPWGKYRYKRLPMGISSAPDIFQHIMHDILGDLDFCRVYIDDVLIISDGSFEDHLAKLNIVLSRLNKANFRANVRKCYFAQDNLEYLGYQLTREGVQPQPQKVEAICRLQAPKTRKQLRHFLGMVNYYRDMWQRRSHTLAPLTKLSSKAVPYKWGPVEQQAFEEIKEVISREALLAFPQFDKPFHIYTDASDYQLGAVITQEGKPLAFYSRKMNKAQQRYTTGEQELLSIVETLKEFRNILLGQKVIIHTDHMNIVYGNLSNDRIVRWRLLLEEFGPEYRHIAGKDNVVADALSRLEMDSDEDSMDRLPKDGTAQVAATCMCMLMRDESYDIPSAMDSALMADCFLNNVTKEQELSEFPMDPKVLYQSQSKDKTLMKQVRQAAQGFSTKLVEGQVLVTKEDKIVVPSLELQERIIAWYHQYLCHPGQTRLEATIRQLFVWSGIRRQTQRHVSKCRQCQLCKGNPKNYGHLPAKEAEPSVPWDRVNVDLTGPFTVQTPKGKQQILLLTAIDPATGWFELKEIADASSDTVSAAMDDMWFCRYPRPRIIGLDGGSEFKKYFKEMIKNYGLKTAQSTPYNPQSNGIIERVHQVLGDALRTFELEEQDLDETDPWTPFLAATAFAIRSTYHTTLGATPAQLVFQRDMILPIKFQADWMRIQQRRQKEINRNNAKENKRRIPHTYKVGDLVSKRRPGILPKLRRKREGPFEVIAVFDNGTVRIRRGAVTERLNIRRIQPYQD